MRRASVLGFNLLFLHPRLPGVRTYAVNLVGRILRQNRQFEIVLFVPTGAAWLISALARAADLDGLPPRVAVEVVDCDPVSKVSVFHAENVRLPAALRRRGIDLLISLDYHGPLGDGPPQVVVVHDMRFQDLPESFSWPQRALRAIVSPRIIARAAGLWTISEFSRDRLLACYPASAGKTWIVGSGGPEPDRRGPAARSDEYFLSVGTFLPHKNYPALLRALLELPDDARLILVGEPGPTLRDRAFRDLLRRAGNRVQILHGVDDDRLRELYRRAHGYVTASLYEGFGLTVLEAMSHGVPVACSNIAALTEVVGDAGLVFDPRQSGQIAAALQVLRIDDPLRRRLVRRGFDRLRRHAWSEAAERALAACSDHLALQPCFAAAAEPCLPLRDRRPAERT